jgi:hypothetical protein
VRGPACSSFPILFTDAKRGPVVRLISCAGDVGQVPKWPKGADCKSVAIGFQGSNPCLPTSGKAQVEVKAEAIERALPLNLNLDLNLFKMRA